ncbi:S66 family peptidase [Risungbinella massiliensis]|uniref:S66 family peptidase n=1 Tax=Risungbinella massiliensis TaxID=1329796 RepID=UPI0005CB9360|nr:S66 peptidase family protein [Risungbinella massiliensis]
MIPKKLQIGDQIRVVAPSRSLSIMEEENRSRAIDVLESFGFNVTFGKHVMESDMMTSSSIASRIEDLHDAFRDPDVQAILTVIGGYNCNQLLPYLDYDLIRQNPKILCGYSDITALSNAIYAKTGLITYSGPHFSTFAMKKGLDYTLEFFQKCLTSTEPITITPADFWSDDPWYREQEQRTFYPNQGWHILQEGKAEGTIIGGNLCTLNLLQGTPFMPSLRDSILFLEDDSLVFPEIWDRDLQSLLQQPDFNEVRGIVIGRFQKESQMTREKLAYIIQTKLELCGIPIVADLDFGHTTPIFTFPIGGQVKLHAENRKIYLEII